MADFQFITRGRALSALTILSCLLVMPRPATAQDAVVSQNVNLRDDPSTQNPAIRLMLPAAAASLREGLSEMFTVCLHGSGNAWARRT